MQKPRQNNSRDAEVNKGMALLIHARRWRCDLFKLHTAAASDFSHNGVWIDLKNLLPIV
jgi:hypothetical protein